MEYNILVSKPSYQCPHCGRYLDNTEFRHVVYQSGGVYFRALHCPACQIGLASQRIEEQTFMCSYCGRVRPVEEKCALAGESGNRAVCCVHCHNGEYVQPSLPDI